MKEFVGKCDQCGKDIYCLEGFLNGVKDDSGKLLCFSCADGEGETRPSTK
ncbi:hypothetical protein [Bacillus marinisedimentorum]|nr:hypothetical protein [Bacillus marinisedimentorum]